MKIGLLTFQNTVNFGAELQLFALYSFLENMGHEVEVINYSCSAIEKENNPRLKLHKGAKGFIWKTFFSQAANTKWSKFREFAFDHMHFSEIVTADSRIEILDSFDAVVVGSDQVWNYDLTGADNLYFLPDTRADLNKIAYAASFGRANIANNEIPDLKRYLPDFRALSIREQTGAAALFRETGIEAQIVLDPTLLPDEDFWNNIPLTNCVQGRYIAAYGIGESRNEVYLKAKELKRKTGLPIVWFSGSALPLFGVRRKSDIGPLEFLSVIKNAEYVVTDSFHGTCFSIIYKKKFQTVLQSTKSSDNKNSRIVDLLKTLNMNECLNDGFYDASLNIHCDALNSARKVSRSFLFKALGVN